MATTKITNAEWIRTNFPAIMNGTANPSTLGWATRKLRGDAEAQEAARKVFYCSSMTEEQKFRNNFPNLAVIIGV